ncbi:MAG: hypothetical protein COT74_07155 [Bdellovibrionales bacterium CG10_big_fil_rev_8_21_14_0_10_45_34]|nr:MAG: hypothetical protein COT74_07155 [Bdellovibrionales bacterium CG10_big_fil_rev_8_21_14_0_10_45_34]
MKVIFFAFVMGLFFNTALSSDNAVIQVDMKFLCEINKMEKSLRKDKTIDVAQLAQRIYEIKVAGLHDEASKGALKIISTMAHGEQSKAWKQFVMEKGIKGIKCL